MMKQIFQNKGFTLVEMILACAIITIFFLGTGAVLSSSAKVYIEETRSSGARGVIETAGDDIKNYIMSGRDVRLFFYMDGERTAIALEDGDELEVLKPIGGSGVRFDKGTILYTDGTYMEPNGTWGEIVISPEEERKLAKVAEGIDLGYKMIYITADGKYIQGLPYSKEFYRDMTMSLQISRGEEKEYAFYVYGDSGDTERLKKQNIYTIRLVGKGANDIFTVALDTAVMSMNDFDFR